MCNIYYYCLDLSKLIPENDQKLAHSETIPA